jgi:hypothetical protein
MTRIFNGVAIIALFLGIIFFWGECDGMDCGKKANSEKISQYFNILSSIFTLFTLMFLYEQLKEMKLARSSSIQPSLYPVQIKFRVMGEKLAIRILKEENDSGFVASFDNIKVVITNIGINAAKNVKIRWEYDIAELNKYCIGTNVYTFREPLESEEHSFVPAGQTINVIGPFQYMCCCRPSLNQEADLLNPGNENSKPRLSLVITYLNLEGEQYEKRFEVAIWTLNENVTFSFSNN